MSARALAIELKEADETAVAAVAGELPDGLAGDRVDAERSMAEGALVVPLIWQGRSYGALVAMNCQKGGPEFSAEDEELLAVFALGAAAVVAAGSLDLARRRERLAAGEARRARWARDLRDQTLEGLRALRLTLAAIEESEPTAAQGLIHQAIAGIETETEKLQSLIVELRPRALDELGVGAAVEALADRTESPKMEVRTHVELGFEKGRMEIRYDEELETAVYRIVQEALGNAIQHAGSSYVVIELTEDDEGGNVRIAVRDDGKGFDPSVPCGGLGLSGMRERVELLGGSLEIHSFPGEGTEVRATMPAVRRRPGAGTTQEI